MPAPRRSRVLKAPPGASGNREGGRIGDERRGHGILRRGCVRESLADRSDVRRIALYGLRRQTARWNGSAPPSSSLASQCRRRSRSFLLRQGQNPPCSTAPKRLSAPCQLCCQACTSLISCLELRFPGLRAGGLRGGAIRSSSDIPVFASARRTTSAAALASSPAS